MAVKLGSARIDENGKARGGKAGDNNKKEVSTQNWYNHTKGWRVFRPLSAEAAKIIAQAMQDACDNNNIGYDQNQRLTLYNAAKPLNFVIKDVKTACETDCSALVRVCCAQAGIMLSNFNTSTQPSRLLNSGHFVELKGDKYTKKSDYLRAGDILCTKTQGHTVIVLTNGPKAEEPIDLTPIVYKLGDRTLRSGDEGEDVKELQSLLIQLDYDLGKWGADGDFGDATELAVREFQEKNNIEADGVVGAKTIEALNNSFVSDPPENKPDAKNVKIKGGNCYVRVEANKNSTSIGVAKRNEIYPYLNMRSEDGWHKILFKEKEGWVSGKYSEVID